MIPSRVNWELADSQIQSMLMRSIFLHLARETEKDHRVHETVVSSAVETIFRGTASITPGHAKAMARKANRASQGPRVLAKERGRWTNPEANPKVPRVPNVRTEERVRKLVCLVWRAETRQKTQETPQADHTHNSNADTSLFDGKGCYDAWHDDLVGTKVGRNSMSIPQTHFFGNSFSW